MSNPEELQQQDVAEKNAQETDLNERPVSLSELSAGTERLQPIEDEATGETGKIDSALSSQESVLTAQEEKHDRKTLSGFKRFVATSMLFGSSLLAVGCEARTTLLNALTPPQKTESGFKDSSRENVQQRLKIKKAEIKNMHINSRRTK